MSKLNQPTDWQQVVAENPDLVRITEPVLNRFIPHSPTPKQSVFLNLNCREALFGGAAGGGKSACLMMGALQYAHVPNYRAILFRKSYSDLTLPGALIDISHQWLRNSGAKWKSKEHYWEFPGNSTVGFGYLDAATDIYRYQSAEFSYIGFDELTQFTETQYRYLFSRLRRPSCPVHRDKKPDAKCRLCRSYGPIQQVPLRMRSATNPGGPGHDWVKARFIDSGNTEERIFLPSKLTDNPYLDQKQYEQALTNLDPVTRRQLADGDWLARGSGGMFRREYFGFRDLPPAPEELVASVRYWDLAASRPTRQNTDPDYAVGVKMGIDRNMVANVINVRRLRGTSQEVERSVNETAKADGLATIVVIERERGGAGKSLIEHYRTRVLPGFSFFDDLPTGEKSVRAGPFASYCQNGCAVLVRAHWNAEYMDELESFPYARHDDQVDATSGAFNWLMNNYQNNTMFLSGTLIMPENELEFR